MYVYLGLAELVEVPEELKNMSTTATGERKWWTVVAQILSESVPVSSLLILVPTQLVRRGAARGRRGGGGSGSGGCCGGDHKVCVV